MRLDRILICALALGASAVPALAADATLFRYDGKEYTTDDASPRLQRMLFEVDAEHFQRRRELAEELLFESYLQSEATRRGTTPRDLARELLGSPPPSEEAVRAFYDANQARIGQPYEAIKERIAEHLQESALRDKKAQLLAGLMRDGGFELLFEPPEAPPVEIDTLGYPHRGAESARIKIVEFGDYQCVHCQRAARVLHRLVEKYPEQVQVVYMDFPINQSGISRVVAEGAACAERQDRYWDYHDLAFDRQTELRDDSPVKLADMLGLDEAAFAECMAGNAGRVRVERSAREGHRLGIRATPSIFVNGKPFGSNHLERDLERIIQEKTDA